MYEQSNGEEYEIEVVDLEEQVKFNEMILASGETVYVLTTYQVSQGSATNAELYVCDELEVPAQDMKRQNAKSAFKELLCVTPQIKIEISIETCAAICRTHECWQLLTSTVRAEIFYEHISKLHKGLIDKVELSKALELRNAQSCVKALAKKLENLKFALRKKIEGKDEEILRFQTRVEWLEELACKIDAIEIIEGSDKDETLPEAQNKPPLDSKKSSLVLLQVLP